MMVENLSYIINHAQGLGFVGVTADKLKPKEWLKFKVEGFSQRDAGRIHLSEIILKNGRRVYVGVIGTYRGTDFQYEK